MFTHLLMLRSWKLNKLVPCSEDTVLFLIWVSCVIKIFITFVIELNEATEFETSRRAIFEDGACIIFPSKYMVMLSGRDGRIDALTRGQLMTRNLIARRNSYLEIVQTNKWYWGIKVRRKLLPVVFLQQFSPFCGNGAPIQKMLLQSYTA